MKKRTKCLAGLGLAYLAAITPRITKRPARMPQVYYAHRGLHDDGDAAPENTLPAFARAAERGYGIELDVQLTKDGQVVVAHDFHLRRICGVDRAIDSLTYEELKKYPIGRSQETVPLFADVLRLVNGRVPLIVELKVKDWSSRIAEKTDELLRCYPGVYCIESFHPAGLLWYRLHHPEICRGQLSWDYLHDEETRNLNGWAMKHLLYNFITAPDFIAYDCLSQHELSKNICRQLFGCPSVAWTIRSQGQLEESRPYFDYFIFENFIPDEK